MKNLSGSEIRETFLRFFEQRGHKRVHSSSLVPGNDPTLLFTNAGMNQFKDVFLGLEKRDYNRATTSQKCVRAGGKHNDLENVGFTNRHHTFFEMLGNFSFGDYFKKDAIAYAWELITSPNWFSLPQDKLYVTIFQGENGVPRDQEAHKHWLSVGIARDRIQELGQENFWAMGDTGPCGPCSELLYDMGPAASDRGHKSCKVGCECGRYVEIWNLVFMQFDRNLEGQLMPLPKPSIDTGMGLERMAAVLQGVVSNYETDLFQPLIRRAWELSKMPNLSDANILASLRIMADHARATAFLVADGVMPSNEGRGYVLRKIMRRAMRHGYKVRGERAPFMTEMVIEVQKGMSDVYPELTATENTIRVVHEEERLFQHTLAIGSSRLDELLDEAKKIPKPMLSGSETFKLYDTFGLPLDFMIDAARDQNITLDSEGFDRAMQEQRARTRSSWKGGAKTTASPAYRALAKTHFLGYTHTTVSDCQVLAIVRNGQGVEQLNPGEEGEVILDRTSFYADSGGQIGDHGWLYSPGQGFVIAEVQGCVMPVQGIRAHRVTAKQPLEVGDKVDAVVDRNFRECTMRNHTGTHLLHAALREVLGKHVKQAGSLVDPQHLRFDFSHFTSVADEELQDIEDLVNKEILKNIKVETIEDVPIDVAINEYKAMALFGEKYGEKVRVVKIGDFSVELCGGTHNRATGEIGLLKILNEGGVSSGVRRVEAVTGTGSLEHFRKDHELENTVLTLLGRGEDKTSPARALQAELEKREADIKRLRKELEQMRMKSAVSSFAAAEEKVREVKGIKVLAHRVDNLERGQMRTLVDNLRSKLGSGVVVLGSASDGKVALIVGVTQDLTSRVQAGKIVGAVAKKVGGSGGGRADMAEAGGKNPGELDNALAQVPAIVESLTQ